MITGILIGVAGAYLFSSGLMIVIVTFNLIGTEAAENAD